MTGSNGTRVDRTRFAVGGAGTLLAVLGFFAAQVAIDAYGLRGDLVLVVLPVFGVLGFASYVVLASALIPARDGDGPSPDGGTTGDSEAGSGGL